MPVTVMQSGPPAGIIEYYQPYSAKRGSILATDHQTIRNLFDDWNAALLSGDPDKVAELYAADAILLPTVSNRVCTDRAAIKDYFHTKFMKMQPHGEIEESHIRVHEDLAVHSGVYLFALQTEGRSVRARFTFVYRLDDGEWKIVEHHSSAMPEG